MTADQLLIFLAGIVGGALRVGVPFLFVSLGECLTEKSGRINLGLEGVLVLSAMSAFGVAYWSGSAWLGVLAGSASGALLALPWMFEVWALPHQLPPEGGWKTWVIMGGRGAGKTRAGAEWVRAEVEGAGPGDAGRARRVALVGASGSGVVPPAAMAPASLFCTSAWRAAVAPLADSDLAGR